MFGYTIKLRVSSICKNCLFKFQKIRFSVSFHRQPYQVSHGINWHAPLHIDGHTRTINTNALFMTLLPSLYVIGLIARGPMKKFDFERLSKKLWSLTNIFAKLATNFTRRRIRDFSGPSLAMGIYYSCLHPTKLSPRQRNTEMERVDGRQSLLVRNFWSHAKQLVINQTIFELKNKFVQIVTVYENYQTENLILKNQLMCDKRHS